MVSQPLIIFYSFFGAFFLGLTAVLLKKAHVDNVYYGLIVRALSSGPLVLILVLVIQGSGFLMQLRDRILLFQLLLATLFLIGADILIMSILKRKPVGIIAPLIAIFPLFTTIMLILTDYVDFSAVILFFTIMIITGVGLVTYDRSIDTETGNRVAPFDKEAIFYGLLIALCLGLTNYMDIIILETSTDIDGLAYTSFKFMMILVASIFIYFFVGNNLSDWKTFQGNRSSTLYLVAAGISAWALGSVFIYTSYDQGDPEVVNAIIGMNPVFAVLVSLFLKMEELKIQKIIGLFLCVVASIGIVNI